RGYIEPEALSCCGRGIHCLLNVTDPRTAPQLLPFHLRIEVLNCPVIGGVHIPIHDGSGRPDRLQRLCVLQHWICCGLRVRIDVKTEVPEKQCCDSKRQTIVTLARPRYECPKEYEQAGQIEESIKRIARQPDQQKRKVNSYPDAGHPSCMRVSIPHIEFAAAS